MAKKLHSPTSLSEFSPLSEDESSKSFSFMNFFKKNKSETAVSQKNSAFFTESINSTQENEFEKNSSVSTNSSDCPDQELESLPSFYADSSDRFSEVPDRNMPRVLKLMRHMVQGKNMGLQCYKDSDFKQYWMPDSNCKECYECGNKFTALRRRHHCRVCGQIFCRNCCNQGIPGNIIGYTGELRVCSYCYKMVTTCMQSLDFDSEEPKDLSYAPSNADLSFDTLPAIERPSRQVDYSFPSRRKSSVMGFREEDIAKAKVDSTQISQDFLRLNKLNEGDVLYKHQTVQQDKEQVQLLSENQEGVDPLWVNEIQYNHESREEQSSDDCTPEVTQIQKSLSRSRIPSSSSSFYLDLDLKKSSVKVSKQTTQSSEKNDWSPMDVSGGDTTFQLGVNSLNEGLHDVFAENLLKAFNASSKCTQEYHTLPKDDPERKKAFSELHSAYIVHETCLLKQLLESNGLSPSWCDVILHLTHNVIDTVHPDIKNDADSMDIRQYVQFKKILGGNKNECSIVRGVVFTKAVAHRKMLQNIFQPSILLLSSPISYQRTEKKLSSLDPVLMQEFEYLKNSIGKLTICKPDVLLVEKSVSRLAQEMLLDFGITVALNVKPSVMERVARCTQASIVSTVDAHLSKPNLGTCESFRVKTFSIPVGNTKTLMFLDGCPSNLGCTLLLRGGSATELKKVKQITQFMLYVAYNWHLESSFLFDEFALPPTCPLDNWVNTSDTDAVKCNNVFEDFDKDDTDVTCRGIACNTNNCSSLKCKTEDHNTHRSEAKYIDDFSDPLQSYLKTDNIVFHDPGNFEVSTLPTSKTFRKLLNEIILCCSMYVKHCLPYFEMEIGKTSPLRKYFPNEIYWSPYFSVSSDSKVLHSKKFNFDEDLQTNQMISENAETLPHHSFVSNKLTDISANDIDTLLSNFRSWGSTIRYLCPHQVLQEKNKKTVKTVIKCSQTTENEDRQNGNISSDLNKVDAMDPRNHQTLAVLFCSYSCISNNAPKYCVNPWVVEMDFYGSNDITLGGFLEKYCFRASYVCPSITCDTPMTEHVRKFVHGSGSVQILLRELSSTVQTVTNSILMWSWCHGCKKVSPVIPMSQDTWSYSFAKYLELRFHAVSYKRHTKQDACMHSLHQDHYQYFAYKNVVAVFEYNPIAVWEINLPSLSILIEDEALTVTKIVDEIKNIAMKGTEMYSLVLEKLVMFKHQYEGGSSEELIASMTVTQKVEMLTFREKIEQIQLRLTSPTLETMSNNSTQVSTKTTNRELTVFMWKLEDQVTLLKYHIAEAVQLWNQRMRDFLAIRRKEERQPQKSTSTIASKITESYESNNSVSNLDEHASVIQNEKLSAVKSDFVFNSETDIREAKTAKVVDIGQGILLPVNKHRLNQFAWLDCAVPLAANSKYSRNTSLRSYLPRAYSEPRSVSYFAKYSGHTDCFLREKLSRSSSESSFTYGVNPGLFAGIMVTEPEDNESYVVCHNDHLVKQHNTERATKSLDSSKFETNSRLQATDSFARNLHELGSEENVKRDKKERTVKTLISQLLSNNETVFFPSPFPPSEHIIYPKGDFEKIPVIVYDDEPSSIIAYTLASSEYEQELQELRINKASLLCAVSKEAQTSSPLLKQRQNSKLLTDSISVTESPLASNDELNEVSDLNECSSLDNDKTGGTKGGTKAPNFHIEIQFNDHNSRFYCRVYYAEQFRKLRCLVFEEGEERYIRSLSHCIPWIVKGGKSGSTFCKTSDDRFILKQMQKLELQSFLELASSYFNHVNKACSEQIPTLLAKIIGVYRIGYKNTATNSASKMDLLVMENLFYGRNIIRKYDLKGSVRNRLVNTTDIRENDIVLLDENLLKINCDNPLYIRQHSKEVLKLAIDNDTQFLAKQLVMDYSLLVGLDEEKTELVVGIIDYIRTFTWDKKVEMIVKSSGILGGHGKLPTVIHPESYLMRFREAMDGYFFWVPDQWFKLGSGVDITKGC